MRLPLLFALGGLPLIALLHGDERLGALLGWSAAWLLEAALLRARLRALRDTRPLAPLLAGGFIARLGLLFVGTLAAAAGAPWSAVVFLIACAAGLLLGEGLALVLLHRSSSRS